MVSWPARDDRGYHSLALALGSEVPALSLLLSIPIPSEPAQSMMVNGSRCLLSLRDLLPADSGHCSSPTLLGQA